MPRKYKRKTDRASISETDMEKAKKDIHESEIPAHQAAKNHGINVNILRSRLKKSKSLTNLPVSSKYTVKQVFTIEKDLRNSGIRDQMRKSSLWSHANAASSFVL